MRKSQELACEKPVSYKPSKQEQETSVVYDRSSSAATVYSANPVDIRKFKDKLKYKVVHEDTHGTTFEVDKRLISFRKNEPKKPRVLTEEQKQKLNQGRLFE
jgi:hypothetical protein